MNALRRALYVQAAVWAVAGAALAAAPGFVAVTLFGQPALPGPAWVRIAGIEAFGLALLMVLVAHRVEELWWWSWAFALVSVGVAAVTLLHAAFGLGPGESRALWWSFAAVSTGFAFWLLYGLFVSSAEQPLPG
ncbi:MAG TPA: hypothetical protein VNO34_08510 [Actinomycetota bacterium]|nr:hypothetical protein [Actinomycetota bacterium]